jgi:hypothetical protein
MSVKRYYSFFQQLIGERLPGRKRSSTRQSAKLAFGWLKQAQDVTGDGGVSAYYSVIGGWAPSFVETTGYIIGTFLRYGAQFKDKTALSRARKMGEFLLKMQLPSGAFRAYPPSSNKQSEPVIFNTGQDLLGICDLYHLTHAKKYLVSLNSCAEFLINTQNKDGSWTEEAYDQKTHAYHSRVGLALVKAFILTKNKNYLRAAQKNLDWTCGLQKKNGWFRQAELPGFAGVDPITHTISYVIEGLLFSGLLLKDKKYLRAALLSLEKIKKISPTKPPFATYDSLWNPTANYICLTGVAQLGYLFGVAFQLTGDASFLNSAQSYNHFLKKTQPVSSGDRGLRGGIAGSYPLAGDLLRLTGYSRLAYLNWATKFFLDSLLQEHQNLSISNIKMGAYVYS